MPAREARYYRKLDDDWVQCTLCPFSCRIPPGSRGRCRVRENRGGVLYTLAYGELVSFDFNPVERIPLYHFYPGSRVLEIATPGCNLYCDFCVSWDMSQASPEDVERESIPPENLVRAAIEADAIGIAYTQTEPTKSVEYFSEIARLARERDLSNIWVTNGLISEDALEEILSFSHALSVTPKSYSKEFYERYCGGGDPEIALSTIEEAVKKGRHVELAYLVIPGLNDDPAELERFMKRIYDSLGEDFVIEFSRFLPSYNLREIPLTPIENLERAVEIARSIGFRFVYLANVFSHPYKNTYCPSCGKLLIKRLGYVVVDNEISEDSRCPVCGERIPILIKTSGDKRC